MAIYGSGSEEHLLCHHLHDLELLAHGASSLRRPVSSTEEWDSYMDHEVKVEAGFER